MLKGVVVVTLTDLQSITDQIDKKLSPEQVDIPAQIVGRISHQQMRKWFRAINSPVYAP